MENHNKDMEKFRIKRDYLQEILMLIIKSFYKKKNL